LDAADNAQIEANAREEVSFPKLLLASLSSEPIEGVKLLLTARPHRMNGVIGMNEVECLELKTFSEDETRQFLETRRTNITDVEFSTAFARSRGNARVLEYLVESWDTNVSGDAPRTEISVDELIAQRCGKIFRDLHTAGWSDNEIREFFAALSLLPPPIPLDELSGALGWSVSQVNSAASDLAPMLDVVKHGVMFRDEPTETYIKDHYASELVAQQAIAQRLQDRQKNSVYAAESLPHFLVVIGDCDRAYQLASSEDFPLVIESDYARRRLRLTRLYAAFSLATRKRDFDRSLSLMMQLSQLASANARGDQFIRRSPSLATALGDSDTSRRLFNDRSGWRGARDVRLVLAYCFSDEMDDARIHQNRAIGWINWYLNLDDETKRLDRDHFEAADVAAVMFLNVLDNNFASFNRNTQIWNFKFAISVIEELVILCAQHELFNGSTALHSLTKFAASKRCLSFALQVVLLTKECGLSREQLKAVSRAASVLTQRRKKKISENNSDYERELQGSIAGAAIHSLIVNSKQSAKRVYDLYHHRRPTTYDYSERHGINRAWNPIQSACIAAWSVGEPLAFHHLMPDEIKAEKKIKSISSVADLKKILDNFSTQEKKSPDGKPQKRKLFSRNDCDNVVEGAAYVLRIVKPIETALLSRCALSNDVLMEFLASWQSVLRPDLHWQSETGKDSIARCVGIGLVKILLRHCETVEPDQANDLIDIIGNNRFSLGDKIGILTLIARRAKLADIAGSYANTLSGEIIKDEYIEQRGESYRSLAESLLPMSIHEAKAYYAQGLAQLDQMGGDDFDLIYSAMHYAAEQPGGYVKSNLSHRLMNLCQTIFQHEPSKFGWTLFGRAAAASIGFPAIYKLIRWYDQDVVHYSYGLPQLACFLAAKGHMDARRAAVLLTVCEDHGWHEWQVGEGLLKLLSVSNSKDRKAIFSVVYEKLKHEHSFGGWEGGWKSLLRCLDAFDELEDDALRKRLNFLQAEARRRTDILSSRGNYGGTGKGLESSHMKKDETAAEEAFSEILGRLHPASATSIDTAIHEIETNDVLRYDSKKRLFDELKRVCPFNERVKFLAALCESAELEFDQTLNIMIDCIEGWEESTAHVKGSVPELIKKLFAFKGSTLFDLRYTGIARQIHRLSDLCGDPKFVLQVVLETVAKERLELGGDEWLQLATSLSPYADPCVGKNALEDLLSSSAARVGDEIGEGTYREAFEGKIDEIEVIADVVWHLLGDSDAFVRWNAARSIKGLLDVGLIDDIENLLDRFETNENPSLASEDHHFAFLNAQQWLLMGLSRATLHHGERLRPLVPRLEALAKHADLHALNKLHLARCLKNIQGSTSFSPELDMLWNEVHTPMHGIVEREGWPESIDRRMTFDFDYDFKKYKISSLGRLFWISQNEATDLVAEEVIKRWPASKNMSDFPGGVRYRSDDRFETYRDHIQKHACLHAVTTLLNNKPVARSPYDWSESNPWLDFLRVGDVSFEDGSWLFDHKDEVPEQAREYLLGKRQGRQDSLDETKVLLRKIGFPEGSDDRFVPLCGDWTSPDGVHVRVVSALLEKKGAVKQCTDLSKCSANDLWLPTFDSNGLRDRFQASKHPCIPLICEPEKYPVGIDEGDEWAARGAAARPGLGRVITKMLRLQPSPNFRKWHDTDGGLALTSSVWGEWKSDPDNYKTKFQDEGAILWAEREWLDDALSSCAKSLIYKVSFNKYKSSRSYDDSPGIKELYVGLRRSGELPRFWYAKKASETAY
jgi:hypothetical protein